MRTGVEKNRFRDQAWRGKNWYRHMLPDPRCSLSLFVWVCFLDTNGLKSKYSQVPDPRCSLSLFVWVCFLDTNGLKVKYCQFLEQFLLISIWDVECIQLSKKLFSQFLYILWVNMFNRITTSNRMSFQIPRLWEKCVTRSTPESFEQCVDVVDITKVIVVA